MNGKDSAMGFATRYTVAMMVATGAMGLLGAGCSGNLLKPPSDAYREVTIDPSLEERGDGLLWSLYPSPQASAGDEIIACSSVGGAVKIDVSTGDVAVACARPHPLLEPIPLPDGRFFGVSSWGYFGIYEGNKVTEYYPFGKGVLQAEWGDDTYIRWCEGFPQGYIVFCRRETSCVLDVSTPDTVLFEVNQPDVSAAAISPDASTLAVGTKDGSIALYNLKTGELIYDWATPDEYVGRMALSDTGVVCAIMRKGAKSKSQAIRLYRYADGAVKGLDLPNGLEEAEGTALIPKFSSDGRWLLLNTVEYAFICDLESGKAMRCHPDWGLGYWPIETNGPWDMAFVEDEKGSVWVDSHTWSLWYIPHEQLLTSEK